MSTVKQLQDAIAARGVVSARKITRDNDFGAGTKKTQAMIAANSAIAAALNGLPDSPEKFTWATKLNVKPSGDSRSEMRVWMLNGNDRPQKAANQILRNYHMIAMNEAGASSARWLDALAKYNARKPYDVRLKSVFDRLVAYFRQGQALPGVLKQKTVIDALRQWKKDAEPGGLDKAVQIAQVVAIAAVGYGVATALMSTAGPVVAASAPSGGTLATSATIVSTSTAASGITVAGVQTGYSTGIALVDSAIGVAGTGAASGAVASGVTGGSVKEGAKAGAKQAVLSSAVGVGKKLLPSPDIKKLFPSPDIQFPKFDIPGSRGGSIVDDIVKNALKDAPMPKLGMPSAVPVAKAGAASGVVQESKQIGAGLDWKLIAGIVSGVAGVISILR